MHQIQQQAFDQAIAEARQAMAQQQWQPAMEQLKRAHVLGQLVVWPHTYTHWLMLLLEWRRRRFGAVVGQLIRMLLGVIGSAVGKVPTGNTGDSDISMFRKLPVLPELQQMMDGTMGHDTMIDDQEAARTKRNANTGISALQPAVRSASKKDTSA